MLIGSGFENRTHTLLYIKTTSIYILLLTIDGAKDATRAKVCALQVHDAKRGPSAGLEDLVLTYAIHTNRGAQDGCPGDHDWRDYSQCQQRSEIGYTCGCKYLS